MHSVRVVVWRPHLITGAPEFLVLEYENFDFEKGKFHPRQTRFVHGSNRNDREETPEETAVWTLYMDTGLMVPEKKIKTVAWRNTPDEDRMRFAYMVALEDCSGEIRRSGFDRKHKRASHPFWMSKEEVDFRFRGRHPDRWVVGPAVDRVLSQRQCA